jgi:hypothetical protein
MPFSLLSARLCVCPDVWDWYRQRPPKKSGSGDKPDEVGDRFRADFAAAIEYNADVETHLSKAQEDLTPLRVQRLFEAMLPEVRA